MSQLKTDEKSTKVSSSSNQSDIIENAIEHVETVELKMSVVPIVGLLIAFSIAGVSIRVKLTELNSYPGCTSVFIYFTRSLSAVCLWAFAFSQKDMLLINWQQSDRIMDLSCRMLTI